MKNAKASYRREDGWQRQIIPRYCQRINARAAGGVSLPWALFRASVPEIKACSAINLARRLSFETGLQPAPDDVKPPLGAG